MIQVDAETAEHNADIGPHTRSSAETIAPSHAPKPLRIIHISKHCGYGNGNVHVAVDLACVQAQAGYEVWFASSGGTFVDMLERHGVRHIILRQDQRKPWTLVKSAFALIGHCRVIRPTILHAHMMGSALIGYAASLVTGIKLVTTVHNSFDRHSVLMRLGHAVVAVSHAERDNLIKRNYRPDKVSVVWNAPDGSPRESFMANDREFRLSRPCVVAICALHRRKGVFDLIAACAETFQDFPEWHLYIAGEGPGKSELQAQVELLGLSARVTFLGFVPAPKTIFHQADIFVLASYADPGSLSIGEARAAGCAIIATAVGGTTEMLAYGEAGRLVAPGTPRQLAVELRRLMRDPDARRQLSKDAKHASDIFNVGRLVDDYGRVYQDVLGS